MGNSVSMKYYGECKCYFNNHQRSIPQGEEVENLFLVMIMITDHFSILQNGEDFMLDMTPDPRERGGVQKLKQHGDRDEAAQLPVTTRYASL